MVVRHVLQVIRFESMRKCLVKAIGGWPLGFFDERSSSSSSSSNTGAGGTVTAAAMYGPLLFCRPYLFSRNSYVEDNSV
jgi:hypothetical protein